jgi:hypothetical protein
VLGARELGVHGECGETGAARRNHVCVTRHVDAVNSGASLPKGAKMKPPPHRLRY